MNACVINIFYRESPKGSASWPGWPPPSLGNATWTLRRRLLSLHCSAYALASCPSHDGGTKHPHHTVSCMTLCRAVVLKRVEERRNPDEGTFMARHL